MAKPNIAILGGRGMLGTDLYAFLQTKNFKTLALDLPEFDITNDDHLKKVLSSADIIINCAAYTNVDKAETHSGLAFKVNAEAVGRLGQLAKSAGKTVFHISTDFVFDGKLNRPYTETDPPNPINIYGKTKLAGEHFLAQTDCEHCIIRLQWTYGLAGGNFITKLLRRARSDMNLKVVDDQLGSPTSTVEAAGAICTLLTKSCRGIFHFAAAGYTTRYEAARFILEKTTVNVNLKPCKTGEFDTPAERPLNSRFDCNKIQAVMDEPIKEWKLSLEGFLNKL